MASAFTVFPNLGFQAKPNFITKIEDYDHVKREETLPKIHKVLSPDIAEKMLFLLQNVVQNGTAAAAKSLARPLGGKTGTTNDFTDAWFIGFSPSLTTAVWVGYDEKKSLGNRESGAIVALPIWIKYIGTILKDKQVEQFPNPEVTEQMASENAGPAAVRRKTLFVEDLPGSAPPPAAIKKP
jgi:penicillin-binding protein 1A